MSRICKIFLIVPVLLIIYSSIYAQTVILPQDTLSVSVQQDKETPGKEGENKAEAGKISEETDNKSLEREGKGEVKHIRGARPDMSRTGGARPPKVTRQSGSGIPKGMGRPGGARGPGRR